MSYYPATVVAVDEERATVRINATGQTITLHHNEDNAVPVPLRGIGTQGMISFPKAPPYFGLPAA